MPTLREPDEEKQEILERLGQIASAEELAEILRGLEARHPLQEDEAEETFEALPLFTIPDAEPPSDSLPLRQIPIFDPPVSEERTWQPEEASDLAEPELLGPSQRPDRSWGTLAAAALLLVALLGAFLYFQRPSSSAPPFAPPITEPPSAEEPPVPLEEPDAPPAQEPAIIEELPAEPEPAPEPEQPMQIAEEEEPAPVPERRASEPVRIAEARRPETPAPRRAVASGPPARADVLRPGPGVEMPIPLELPAVRYPEAARGRGLRVDVHLDLLVDEQGKVVEALVREGDDSGLGFNEAAVKAALDTRFQPATRWDLPGKAWTELILEFEEPALESEAGR